MQQPRFFMVTIATMISLMLILSACQVQLTDSVENGAMAGGAMADGRSGLMEEEHSAVHDTVFTRHAMDVESPSGHSVAMHCQDPSADYPYTPYDWPDASATLEVMQMGENSMVSVEVTDAKPETYYTIWLRLGGMDSNGDPFGGNPLTGGNGNASFSTTLDFPLNGAYPFQKFEGFDPTDERLSAENPTIFPVAIVGPNGPYTLRIVSHCTDGLGHGLKSGDREWWFDWKLEG